MRIVQVVLPDASEYERKSQRIDRTALSAQHEVLTVPLEGLRESAADVAHIYAGSSLPRSPLIGVAVPYVANVGVRKSRWAFRQPAAPAYVLTPADVPEAVEEEFFAPLTGQPRRTEESKVIGSLSRDGVKPIIEQTLHRLGRIRDDVSWRLFEQPPAPVDLTGVDIWVDPTADENDFDGFVAEALVAGLPVVAGRTAINARRLEKGRTGFLVPPGDPNEMTHAILSALFRPEVASSKVAAAKQTASRFRARQRLRVLVRLYENLVK